MDQIKGGWKGRTRKSHTKHNICCRASLQCPWYEVDSIKGPRRSDLGMDCTGMKRPGRSDWYEVTLVCSAAWTMRHGMKCNNMKSKNEVTVV